MSILFTNNAAGTLASAISPTATTLTLSAGQGSAFPSPTGADYFIPTLISALNQNVVEILHCTSRSVDTMTVVRAREGTSALSWNTNDLFQLRLTAAGLMAITGAVSALTAGYGINISNASGNFTISDTQTVTAGTNMSVGHTGTVWTVNCTINTALYALLTGATFSGAVQINNNLTVTGTGNFNTSAMNTKENIRDVPLDVARFLRLKPINYTHKEMQEETAGFTAENIYEVYPELVHLDKEGHPFSVNYQGIIPYVAKLVQHHQQTVVSMKKRVEELESQLKKRKKAAH